MKLRRMLMGISFLFWSSLISMVVFKVFDLGSLAGISVTALIGFAAGYVFHSGLRSGR